MRFFKEYKWWILFFVIFYLFIIKVRTDFFDVNSSSSSVIKVNKK